MVSREPEQVGFSSIQRLFLLHVTTISAEDVLSIDDSAFDYDFLKKYTIKIENLVAAGLGPKKLKNMVVSSAHELRSLGFDALHMTDPKFAAEAMGCYGSEEVIDAFLTNASDAVALAGSDAVDILGVITTDLLKACAGAPTEGYAVLQQLRPGLSLEGVNASVILDSGLRASSLQELGYSLTAMVKQTNATSNELSKLGYSLKL